MHIFRKYYIEITGCLLLIVGLSGLIWWLTLQLDFVQNRAEFLEQQPVFSVGIETVQSNFSLETQSKSSLEDMSVKRLSVGGAVSANSNVSTSTNTDSKVSLSEPTQPLQTTKSIKNIKLPKKDLSLSSENKIYIPKIGVDAPISNIENSELALKTGAWLDPNFRTPSSNILTRSASKTAAFAKYVNYLDTQLVTKNKSMSDKLTNVAYKQLALEVEEYKQSKTSSSIILASHVYGYDHWDWNLREKISFMRLHELEPGDKVEIVWDQRSYTYEIDYREINSEITNYRADLVLYTCTDLSGSENRLFLYANLVVE